MTGAPARLLAWLVVLATLLTGCTPAVDLDEAATERAITASSAPPADVDPAPQPTLTATPTPAPVPTPPPVPQAFAVNLYQEGDFVPQYTFDWCVAASIQMAHNLIDDTGGASWADPAQQGELWEMARARSSNSFNGANPLGWAQVLTEVGMGPYTVVSIADRDDALQTAARAIAATGRPVGLVMWSGRHAWVMSGFESIGDPAQFLEFSVTGVRVQDPLYPHGSGQWGPSPAPNSLLTPEQRRRSSWSASRDGGAATCRPAT